MKKEALKKRFSKPDDKDRPSCFFTLTPPSDAEEERALLRYVGDLARKGFSVITPQLPEDFVLTEENLPSLRRAFRLILAAAEKKHFEVGFSLDAAYEAFAVQQDDALRAKMLTVKEYICTEGERVRRKLHEGELLSIVGFSEETNTIVDLRPFIEGDTYEWTVPAGNFVVREYLAVKDTSTNRVNNLSFPVYRSFAERTFALFAEDFAPYLGKILTRVVCIGVGFWGDNHRAWDASFGEVFEKRFHYDPAPFYPALFGYIGPDTKHRRAHLMNARAAMLENGFFRAIEDFSAAHKLTLAGTLTASKISASTLTAGDAVRALSHAPTALMDRAPLYGTNSLHIAAGAAKMRGKTRVDADFFRHYTPRTPHLMKKDVLNSFALGANKASFYVKKEDEKITPLCRLAATLSAVLGEGAQVSDIAMLYPLYHLQSRATLYISPVKPGFEYPATNSDADYMTLLNAVTIYAGHSVALLHPDLLDLRGHTKGGVLYVDKEKGAPEEYRVLLLPATNMIRASNLRLLLKFYREGGKLIATGLLPDCAFEAGDDSEDAFVRDAIREIFGADACNPLLMKDFCHNQNAAGGEAYFLYFNDSASDGTRMTRSSTVNEALNSLGVNYDVYLPGMPRLECTGALNLNYPDFHGVGLDRGFPGGGFLNYTHRRAENFDVYYFSNTSARAYRHRALLRGAMDVEEWNPLTREHRTRPSTLLLFRGDLYTNLSLTLPPDSALFLIGTARGDISKAEKIDAIGDLRSLHAALMSEF